MMNGRSDAEQKKPKKSGDVKSTRRDAYNESGVSEVVGAILLISLVVICVAIIGVYLFSQPLPEKIPNLQFLVGSDNPSTPSQLFLYHNGGDPLTVGEFSVLVDGVSQPYSVASGGNQWALGEYLVINNITTVPQDVKIVYGTATSGSGQTVIRSASSVNLNKTDIPDVIPTPPICSCCNIDLIPPDDILEEIMKNITYSSETFLRRDIHTRLYQCGNLSFRVTKPNSTMSIATDNKNLTVGDTVKISLSSRTSYFKFYGLGGTFSTIRGNYLYITLTHAGATTPYYNGVSMTLNNAWITGYDSLDSTLSICSPGESGGISYWKYTLLVMNSTMPEIDRKDPRDIKIMNIHPNLVGLFVLDWDSTSSEPGVYYTGGTGDNYLNDIICIPPDYHWWEHDDDEHHGYGYYEYGYDGIVKNLFNGYGYDGNVGCGDTGSGGGGTCGTLSCGNPYTKCPFELSGHDYDDSCDDKDCKDSSSHHDYNHEIHVTQDDDEHH
jgi:FlaG/FlaF family flagellin (archaellin)